MAKKINNNVTLDDLAGMVKHGFDEVDKRFGDVDKRFDDVDKRFDRVEKTLKEFKSENSLEHEEIKLKLDQVAYRFEVQELDRRLKRVEAKLGIK